LNNPTREQIKAQKVYERVMSVKQLEKAKQEEYGRICLNYPAFLYACGLCQSVAFYQAKSKGDSTTVFYRFLEDLASLLGMKQDAFAQRVRTVSVIEYQYLTEEVMSISNWFKRYAEAILKVETGGEKIERL
jgi:CRISPR-associated protein Cmr5